MRACVCVACVCVYIWLSCSALSELMAHDTRTHLSPQEGFVFACVCVEILNTAAHFTFGIRALESYFQMWDVFLTCSRLLFDSDCCSGFGAGIQFKSRPKKDTPNKSSVVGPKSYRVDAKTVNKIPILIFLTLSAKCNNLQLAMSKWCVIYY